MSEARAKRQIKTPKKYDRTEYAENSGEKSKFVFRPLKESDVTEQLQGAELWILWPDDGTWYQAVIEQIDVAESKAAVLYVTTDETEDLDLIELINEDSIAFREQKPDSYTLAEGEVLDTVDRPDARQAAEPDEDDDDDEEASLPDEDPSDAEMSEEEKKSEDVPGGGPEEQETTTASGTKRKRDLAEGVVSGRPKRQITLSSKAQDLLSVERAAQLQSILQGRDGRDASRLEEAALEMGNSAGEDKFLSAEAYEQRLLSRISGQAGRRDSSHSRSSASKPSRASEKPGSMGQAQFYGRQQSGGSGADVRKKVVEQINAALSKVAGETPASASALPDTNDVAKQVETALFKFYGDAGKEYKAKYRSLAFNLRDNANPDLRRRVLLGEITPAKLVRLTAVELASKELNTWREEKEKEAMKNAVLDDQAASKFSTAAALASVRSGNRGVDWRDNTLDTGSPRREPETNPEPQEFTDKTGEGDGAPNNSTDEPSSPRASNQGSQRQGSGLIKMDSVKSPAVTEKASNADTELPPHRGNSAKIDATFDWSSVKMTERQKIEQAKQLQELQHSSKFASTVPKKEEAPEGEEYDPEEMETGDQTEALASQFNIAESEPAPDKLWEGDLGNACPILLPVVLEHLAGSPKGLTYGFPAGQVDVKGRLQLERAEDYLKNLKSSRSRTASLGLLRSADSASEEQRGQFSELIHQYTQKDRCAVFHAEGVEYYLVPNGRLAKALVLACNGGELPPETLLLVCIHHKVLQDFPSKTSGRLPSLSSAQSQGGRPHTPSHNPQLTPAVNPPQVSALTPPPSGAHTNPTQGPPAPASVSSAANTIAAALKTEQFTDVVSDPRLAETQNKSQDEIASELMIPQGLDLSSLSSIAQALGLGQGLNLLASHQQGERPPNADATSAPAGSTARPQPQPNPHPGLSDPRGQPYQPQSGGDPRHQAGLQQPAGMPQPAAQAAPQGQALPGPPYNPQQNLRPHQQQGQMMQQQGPSQWNASQSMQNLQFPGQQQFQAQRPPQMLQGPPQQQQQGPPLQPQGLAQPYGNPGGQVQLPGPPQIGMNRPPAQMQNNFAPQQHFMQQAQQQMRPIQLPQPQAGPRPITLQPPQNPGRGQDQGGRQGAWRGGRGRR